MYVALAKLGLVIGDSHSLKDKRMVLRRIKDRVRDRVHVMVNEVGHLDDWQRSELGCAIVSADRGKALALLDDVIRVAVAAGGAQIVTIAKEVTTFDGRDLRPAGSAAEGRRGAIDGDSQPFAAIDDRTGAADKAQGQGDAEWVPDEWKDAP